MSGHTKPSITRLQNNKQALDLDHNVYLVAPNTLFEASITKARGFGWRRNRCRLWIFSAYSIGQWTA